MGRVLRVATDFLMGTSVVAWVSGPLMEKFAIEPTVAKAEDKEKTAAILGSAYKAYSNVVHIGMAGMLVTGLVKLFSDDMRKKDKGYRTLAIIGDVLVFSAIALGGATRMISKKIKTLDPHSSEAEKGKQRLSLIGWLSIFLSLDMLAIYALQRSRLVGKKSEA
jgi:uncharacterized membrane protein